MKSSIIFSSAVILFYASILYYGYLAIEKIGPYITVEVTREGE